MSYLPLAMPKIRKKTAFDDFLRIIPALEDSQRETIEIMLDEAFTHTILKRAKELKKLKAKSQLLSLAQLQEEFRA